MAKPKAAGFKDASSASKLLISSNSEPKSRTAAGCTVSQTRTSQDNRASKSTKTVAASALSQRPSKGKK